MPFNPFSVLTSKIFAGTSLALTLALALCFMWGRAGWRDAHSYELALDMQQKAMTAAQAAAQARAVTAKIKAENETADLARKADNAEDQIAGLRAAAEHFRDARRVHGSTEGAGCSPSGSASPSPVGPAPDRDGPGEDAVVLTRPEYQDLVDNSLRLEQVRLWGESLIVAKRAIPEAEFGKGELSQSDPSGKP